VPTEIKKEVIIFGAGPAGLAAGLKLAENNKPVLILEKERQVGGICKTIEFKGCRFDLGGHRFYTKVREVETLWQKTLGEDFQTRPRLSRMYYRNKFFAYPVKQFNALLGLGFFESFLIFLSYLKAKFFPYKEEDTFDKWVTNRFGSRLYKHFFKSYTEKLWGIPCEEIQAEWVAQRIKGLSFTSAVKNALFPQKEKLKTLIDKFQYPKYGPGMMYEKMAENIQAQGGEIFIQSDVDKIFHQDGKIISIEARQENGEVIRCQADYFLSSMPITELVKKMSPAAPEEALQAARNLTYRSLISISVILKAPNPFPDTWIYVQSPEVKMGRIQNFRSWSDYMVENKEQIALGLEYFCTEGDELWDMADKDLIKLGLEELNKIKLAGRYEFIDGFVARVPKTYPVYNSTYPASLKIIKDYLAQFTNLQPIGRYGMFKYNNMDHSILAGLYAAENILGAKHDIWGVNADQEYQEEKY